MARSIAAAGGAAWIDFFVLSDSSEDNGERAITQKALALRLKDRGFVGDKDKRGNRVWRGLQSRVPGAKFR